MHINKLFNLFFLLVIFANTKKGHKINIMKKTELSDQ
jgi:hypothetical protein